MRKESILLIAGLITLTGCSQNVNENISNDNGNTSDEVIITEEVATTINTTAAPTTTVAETSGDVSYSQQDSVEDYQKAYAEFLNSIEHNYSANIIHINEDDVPELSVQMDTENAYLYGFDDNGVYEIGVINVDSNTIDFLYRPNHSMFSCHRGSVMLGDRHKLVYIIGEENGRLTLADEVHIVPDERTVECDGNHINASDDTAKYDIYNYEYGESWKKTDDSTYVTDGMIQYWLNN